MRRPALATIVLACLFAACGGEEDQPERPTVTLPASKGLRVVGREYSFDPANVVLTGGGGEVTVTLENRGSLAHNVKVLRGESDFGGSPTFPGGETRSGRVRLAPGSYRLVCTVGDHEQLGMTGELQVRR